MTSNIPPLELSDAPSLLNGRFSKISGGSIYDHKVIDLFLMY